ncbi:hypothetical protein [Microvirga mediterraneensis]|uniref:Uncharacterized protein n=1 Tax=Microvirga mediterraneensis TaxID=2754695 RepID=A0A838BPD6_9HYPH|nr:hypothetical protein [Microvirga mediterraneensis]MBA1156919.1 hypothetical protein [Microvirga mediterraneensis]
MFHRNLPENFCGGFVSWRLIVLHHVAKALGLLVKVEGFPYGTTRNLDGKRKADLIDGRGTFAGRGQ